MDGLLSRIDRMVSRPAAVSKSERARPSGLDGNVAAEPPVHTDAATLQHELDVIGLLQDRDVPQRVGVDRHEVAEAPAGDCADVLLPPEARRGEPGGGPQ